MGARNHVGIGMSYRPTRLHRLAELCHGIGPGLLKSLKIRALVRLQRHQCQLDCSAAKRSYVEISSPIKDDSTCKQHDWQSAEFSRQDCSWSTGAGACRISSRTSTATFMVSSKFFLPRKIMRNWVTRYIQIVWHKWIVFFLNIRASIGF